MYHKYETRDHAHTRACAHGQTQTHKIARMHTGAYQQHSLKLGVKKDGTIHRDIGLVLSISIQDARQLVLRREIEKGK